jgi:hypothetical protein
MKRKLSLDLNELRVETFTTDEAGERRGTVRAYVNTDCCTFSCQGTCGIAPDSDLNAIAQQLSRPIGQCSNFCCA